MHTFKPEVLKKLIEHIKPYIKEEILVIPEWRSFSGVHIRPVEIELDSQPASIMKLGGSWEATLDTTRYFEAEVTVPDSFADRKVYFTVDFGGEAIVRINGEIAGAVSSEQSGGWVGRHEILFHRPLKAGEKLFIQIENGINAAGYFDYHFPGDRPAPYVLETAELSVINTQTEALWFDMSCAFDIYENTEDEYVKKRVYNAVDDALHMLDFDFEPARFYAGVDAAREKLYAQLEKINYATPGSVIMCGHSHLDVAWLWTKKEIYRKCARTFSNNLSLMKEYPDFRFTQSQAAVYDFVKQKYPEVYAEIKHFVDNGQWEITGNAWVEADTNLASGESLIRQLLTGTRFFREEFGVASDIYWLPDCFGFTAALPQIIKRSDMKYFLTSKLQYNDTNEFPKSVFRWRSHSGDEVLAYMQKAHYEGEADAAYIVKTRKSNLQNDLVDASMGMFGYGDGGGGCTYQMLERLRRFEKMPGLPSVKMGQAADFFREAEKSAEDLPVWDGEMYYENHRGTFTSQAFVKKNNRKGEFMLRNAEMLSLAAGTYDADRLDKLWKLLLVNQFHDILPGSSIHEVFENTRQEYEIMNSDAAAYIQQAFDVLNKKAGVGEKSIVVWNLIAEVSSSTVSVKGDFAGCGVKDASGRVMTSSFKDGVLSFCAENVPSMGYKVFFLCPEEKTCGVTADEHRLENAFIKAEFNSDGALCSLTDKRSGKETLAGPSNLLSVSQDKPNHESAWNLENDYKLKMWYLGKPESMRLVENTPLKAVIRTVHRFGKSVITQNITLTSDASTLIFDTAVDWQETEKVLKAEFNTDTRARFATFDIAHGAVERPTYANNCYEEAMFEYCAHKWADISDAGRGLSVINDCKYGYDVSKNILRITLMRSPNLPDLTADKGLNTFRYGCYPHSGGLRSANTVYEALKENIPMYAFAVENGEGAQSEKSFISLSVSSISVDAVKKAEDGNGIIIRLNEAGCREDCVEVTLPFSEFTVNECSAMERDIQPPQTVNGAFRFTVKPYEVRTFRIVPLK